MSIDGLRDFREHAIRRRPWTRAMNISAISCYTDSLKDKIHELLGVLRQHEGVPVDLAHWLSLFGLACSVHLLMRVLTQH